MHDMPKWKEQKLKVVEVVTDACSQKIKMLGKKQMFLNFMFISIRPGMG